MLDTSAATIDVRDVSPDAMEFRDFLALPEKVYQRDPRYTPSTLVAVRASVLRPTYRDRQLVCMAYEGGKAVARAVARVSSNLQNEEGDPLGMIGFFEALPNLDAVQRLLGYAVGWLKSQGVQRVVGPMDGDTWHTYRFVTGPYDEPPFLMEPYNARYYAKQWEAFGFRPVATYVSKRLEDLPRFVESLAGITKRVLKQGFTMRTIDMDKYEEELDLLYGLTCDIFAGNYLYEPIQRNDFVDLYADARPIVDPDFVTFAHGPDGAPVGFVFALPDYALAMAAMGGQRNLWAKLRFLMNKRAASAVNVKTLGVLKSVRKSGVGAALFHRAHESAMHKGYTRVNHCLMKSDNASMTMDRGLGTIIRNYVLYEWTPHA